VATFPRQAWMHKDGKVDLKALGAVPCTTDQLVDRSLIAEAFNRFAMSHDEARLDVLSSCFTDDAVYEVAKGSAEPIARMEGKQSIISALTTVVANQADQRRHCMTNIVVESLDEHDALALAFGVVTVAADDLITGAACFYKGELRKSGDGFWRFSYLFIGMDNYIGPEPNPDRR
jgi:hypothetical protein